MKLVRNNIPRIIADKGETGTFVYLDDDDYTFYHLLQAKLVEEVSEVMRAAPDEMIEELADVLQVVDEIMAHLKIDPKDVLEIKAYKRGQKGDYSHRCVWDEKYIKPRGVKK